MVKRTSELWTIDDVAAHLGIQSNSADTELRRHKVPAVARQPGRGGKNLYDAAAIRALTNSPDKETDMTSMGQHAENEAAGGDHPAVRDNGHEVRPSPHADAFVRLTAGRTDAEIAELLAVVEAALRVKDASRGT